MDLSNTTMFQMFEKRMSHSLERQRVLSENVANVNTPKFRPSDVRGLDFKKMLQQSTAGLPTAKTSAGHIEGTRLPQKFRSDIDRKPNEVLISGNQVSLEDEMAKIAETQGLYSLTVQLYDKHTQMLKTAVTKP